MITSGLLTAVALVFDGGNDAQLVGSLSGWLEQPVALLASNGVTWPKAVITAQDEADRRRLLRLRLGLDVAKRGWGLAPAPYPANFINLFSRGYYHRENVRRGEGYRGVIKNDQISFVTTKDAVPLEDALRVGGGLKEKYTIHWFFDSAALYISANGVDEKTYVATIADAIGANLVKVREGWYFDFDPRIYRRRAAAYFRARITGAPFGARRAKNEFDLAVLNAHSDQELYEVFRDKEAVGQLHLRPNAEVIAAAGNRLYWERREAAKDARGTANLEFLTSGFGGDINWETLAFVNWTFSGTACANYRGMRGGEPYMVGF